MKRIEKLPFEECEDYMINFLLQNGKYINYLVTNLSNFELYIESLKYFRKHFYRNILGVFEKDNLSITIYSGENDSIKISYKKQYYRKHKLEYIYNKTSSIEIVDEIYFEHG